MLRYLLNQQETFQIYGLHTKGWSWYTAYVGIHVTSVFPAFPQLQSLRRCMKPVTHELWLHL